MVRTLRTIGIVAFLALSVLGPAASAAALIPSTLVDLPIGSNVGTTHTHPGEVWWRENWGNSLMPDIDFTAPSVDTTVEGSVIGMLYSVTTTPEDLDPDTPDLYHRAGRGSGTNLNKAFDLMGIYRYPPPGGWRSVPTSGATSDLEGYWWINVLWFTTTGYCGTETLHIRLGEDVTAPSRIESLCVSPTREESQALAILPTSRAHLLWKQDDYDALSGTAYYQVWVDGVRAVPEEASSVLEPDEPEQGRIYVLPGFNPRSATLENLSPGRHVLGVSAVDRATNEGPISTVTVYSDPDTPTISFRTPSGYWLPRKPQLSVVASDAGGITNVVYRLDGHPVATVINGPYYSATPDLKYFPGGWHVLSATVTDVYGRSAVVYKSVRLDTHAPGIRVSSSVKRLKVTIRAHTTEAGTVGFWYNTSTTSTEGRTVYKTVNKKGTYSITFSVPRAEDSSNLFYLGARVPWQVRSWDRAGNASSLKKGRITVRFYKLVKNAKNQVKVVKY